MTFKSRLALWFSAVLSISLLSAGLAFTVIFYTVSLVNLEKFFIREGNEIQEKHFQLSENKILFKRDENGKTLAGYLIDEGISAKIVDLNNRTLGKYGIFNSGNANLENLASTEDIDRVKKNNRAAFHIENIPDNSYLIYIKPMLADNKPVGYLILASNMNIGQQMLMFALVLLALVIPVSIILGWLMISLVVKKGFKPLEVILEKMKRVELGTLKEKIQVSGNDQDELVRLTKSYNLMVSRLEADVNKQRDFIANASHELKSPLTKAILNLEMIKIMINEGKTEAAETELSKLQSKFKKFGDMIGSLLEIARVNNSNTEPSKINVRKSIEEIVTENQNDINKKILGIKYKIPPRLIFIFPETHWKILLNNIINNALKYSQAKSGITIAAGVAKNSGYIKVSNRPVHHIDLKKIWKRFYSRGSNDQQEGYGIGLSLVQEVVKVNKLKINIENDKEIFTVKVERFRQKRN